MRVLVTGGAGFLGSHLCRRLLEKGNEVICLDNLFTGNLNNISDLTGRDGFTFIEHDVTEPIDIRADRIFNLACPASPIHYQKEPVKTLFTSIKGMENMLELAVKYGARILQTSTSEIYGEPLQHPQQESYWGNVNPIGLRSCYDEGKRCAEAMLFAYRRQYGTDIRIVRLFNAYGPCMSTGDGRVVPGFITAALQGEDIAVYGDGSQTRSFCFVDDTVEGILRMMDSEGDFTGPVNIGNPAERTIQELAETILELTGSSSRIVYEPLPADDPTRRRPDISLAAEKLHWQPQVDLRTGLEKTIRYFAELQKQQEK